MNQPTYMAALYGLLLTVLMVQILLRRIRTKIFVGDGSDDELKQLLQRFKEIFRLGTIGLLLLFALDFADDESLFHGLFGISASFLLFVSLVPVVGGKRENGVMLFGYIIQRAIFVIMTGATSLYLLYLWAAPELAD